MTEMDKYFKYSGLSVSSVWQLDHDITPVNIYMTIKPCPLAFPY